MSVGLHCVTNEECVRGSKTYRCQREGMVLKRRHTWAVKNNILGKKRRAESEGEAAGWQRGGKKVKIKEEAC